MIKGHLLVHGMQQSAAIFGRQKETHVVFEGEGAYTDGKEIKLPALPDDMDFSLQEAMVMRGYLDHEAGHVRHTDFTAVNKFGKTCSETAFAISNMLEDIRLEHLVMQEYAGTRKNLKALWESVGPKRLETTKSSPDYYEKITAQSIGTTIISSGRLDYAGPENKEIHDMLPERFKAWGEKWRQMAIDCKNTTEIINLALEIEKLLEQSAGQKPQPMDSEKQNGSGEGLNGNPEDFTFDPNGDITRGGQNRSQSLAEKQGKLVDKNGKEISPDVIKEAQKNLQSKIDGYMKMPSIPSKSDYRVLSTRDDEVFERGKPAKREDYRHEEMQKAPAHGYEQIKSKLGGTVNTMKAKLRRALMAKEMLDWDYGREDGKLDSKRLVAGFLGSPTVYKVQQDRLDMDTAVHLLIDLSGSMGGNKIKVAMETAIAFAECLEGTMIKYQISGFDNSGDMSVETSKALQTARRSNSKYHRYEPLNLFKFKKFGEPLQQAKGPMSYIGECASGNNSDRDAVLWAYRELRDRPEQRKILFVLSDGQPANAVVGQVGQGALVKGLKNAVDEVTKAGVECVGIGILTDHVKTLYPKAVHITQVEDLSGAVFTQLSNLLTGGKVNL